MPWRTFKFLLKETLLGWWEDKAPRFGSSLAYYTVLALAPIVIMVTPVAGRLFGLEEARREVVAQFHDLAGPEGAEAVRTMLSATTRQKQPGAVATLLSSAVLVFAASGVFAQLQDALDTIWEVAPKPGRAALLSFLRKRFLSFAMVLGICFLLLVSLIVAAALGMLRGAVDRRVTQAAWVWTVSNGVVSFAIITLLFAMIFKILPDAAVAWRDVWIGAAITSGLFELGKLVIGLYLGHWRLGSAYGGAGSIVVLLVWVYYSAQILFLGAEFTHAYALWREPRILPEEHAEPVTQEARAQQGLVSKG